MVVISLQTYWISCAFYAFLPHCLTKQKCFYYYLLHAVQPEYSFKWMTVYCWEEAKKRAKAKTKTERNGEIKMGQNKKTVIKCSVQTIMHVSSAYSSVGTNTVVVFVTVVALFIVVVGIISIINISISRNGKWRIQMEWLIVSCIYTFRKMQFKVVAVHFIIY